MIKLSYMSASKKALAVKLMPVGAAVGCALFVVLSLALVVFAFASKEYLLAIMFLPGVILFGLPFCILSDPEKVAQQRAEQTDVATEDQREPNSYRSNNSVVLFTLIVGGIIALAVLWGLIGIIASLPVGVLLTIIILLLVFR